MSTFVILLGGDLTVTDRLRRQVEGARFLAADGGMRHALRLGVVPELWLGDFDSTDPDLLEVFAEVPRQTFPVAKDMTDGELALNKAYQLGATRVILCGAFGGDRTDHTLLHLTMATRYALEGRQILLSSGFEEAYPLVPGNYQYDLPEASVFSILSFSQLEGLTIEQAEWPLDKITLPLGSSLTVSNVVHGTLHVSLRLGHAVLIARPL
ncbi:thiamine diphosphokinase [Paenochrobactrum pullorum]|uniref:thiamine diphosphokinase n=1 Tax=Paenochrobactrum pullorum TaxID=1324351 RepID=UPI0035BBE262